MRGKGKKNPPPALRITRQFVRAALRRFRCRHHRHQLLCLLLLLLIPLLRQQTVPRDRHSLCPNRPCVFIMAVDYAAAAAPPPPATRRWERSSCLPENPGLRRSYFGAFGVDVSIVISCGFTAGFPMRLPHTIAGVSVGQLRCQRAYD